MTSSSKNWCFTINNYTQEEYDSIYACPDLEYVILAKEVGECGTPHIQGFLVHKKKTTRRKILKLMPRAHLEVAIKSAAIAAGYCKKTNDYVERGKQPMSASESRKRTWSQVIALARSGDYDTLANDHPSEYLRYHRTIKSLKHDYTEPSESIPELDNEWYYGATGVGKTRSARERYPDAYIKNPDKWWDSYAGQDTVIIDDWSPDHSNMVNHLKVWADHYTTRQEFKGGSFMIRPKKIIITSQYTIEECFPRSVDVDALKRRFKSIHLVKL